MHIPPDLVPWDIHPGRVEDDQRVRELLRKGWKLQGEYDPKVAGELAALAKWHSELWILDRTYTQGGRRVNGVFSVYSNADARPLDRKMAQRGGWRYHNNFKRGDEMDLEEAMHTSDSVYYRPRNARETRITSLAYGLLGDSFPDLEAIYCRDFRPETERPIVDRSTKIQRFASPEM